MALKLNIQPELDQEINVLIEPSGARSKTEYINLAIKSYNDTLKRKLQLDALKPYFKTYRSAAKKLMRTMSHLR